MHATASFVFMVDVNKEQTKNYCEETLKSESFDLHTNFCFQTK